jgi:hypothetical protein
MNSLEESTSSFIVRVWIEETAEETSQATWRGSITHVQSGEEGYLEDLDEIAAFIAPYLQAMGVKLESFERVKTA